MPIEWMPRSRARENGWRDLVASPAASPSTADPRGIRVPVVRGPVRPSRIGFFLMWLGIAVFQIWLRPAFHSWWATVPFVVWLVVFGYRGLRLRRWSTAHRTDIVLTPAGLEADGLSIPWSQVEQVVLFTLAIDFRRGGDPRVRNVLAVRVRDFVGVSGLSPFRAGLANLTRRHLVVIAEASQLRAPEQLAAALAELVAHPASRAVLGTPDGCRLVDEGPARPRTTSL